MDRPAICIRMGYGIMPCQALLLQLHTVRRGEDEVTTGFEVCRAERIHWEADEGKLDQWLERRIRAVRDRWPEIVDVPLFVDTTNDATYKPLKEHRAKLYVVKNTASQWGFDELGRRILARSLLMGRARRELSALTVTAPREEAEQLLAALRTMAAKPPTLGVDEMEYVTESQADDLALCACLAGFAVEQIVNKASQAPIDYTTTDKLVI